MSWDVYEHILSRLKGLKETPNGHKAALCPAHEDRHHSLSLTLGREGNLLVKCHAAQAGCSFPAIAAALGCGPQEFYRDHYDKAAKREAMRPRIDKAYDYHNADGVLMYQAVRMVPKDFRQRRPMPGGGWAWSLDGGVFEKGHDGAWFKSWAKPGCVQAEVPPVDPLPYRLPQVLNHSSNYGPYRPLCIVEGEKDVETLVSLGLNATCNSGGAGKWQAWWLKWFSGTPIAIFPDRDFSGWMHANEVAKMLAPAASTIRIVELPGIQLKEDVTDFVNRQRGPKDDIAFMLERHIDHAPLWTGASQQNERTIEQYHRLLFELAKALGMSRLV